MATEVGASLLKDGYFVYKPSLFQVKLTNSNYPQWRDDISDLLFGLELSHVIDGSSQKPVIPTTGATDAQKTDALKWERQDRLLRHSLSASMSESIRPYIASVCTSRAIWTTLEQIFGSKTRARVIGLKEQLHHISQGDRSVTEYLHQVRQIAEELSHIDGVVGKENLTLYGLHGLREEFREIESSIHTREQPYEIDELHAVLDLKRIFAGEIASQALFLRMLRFMGSVVLGLMKPAWFLLDRTSNGLLVPPILAKPGILVFMCNQPKISTLTVVAVEAAVVVGAVAAVVVTKVNAKFVGNRVTRQHLVVSTNQFRLMWFRMALVAGSFIPVLLITSPMMLPI